MKLNPSLLANLRTSALACAVSFALVSCGSDVSNEPQKTNAEALGVNDVPQIDFSSRPSYLPNNTLALTFDDGPDHNNTVNVLNVLRDKGVRASFYINSQNWSDLASEPPMQDLVRRMVNEGHDLGNHTVHHPHLATLDSAGVEAEIAGVEAVVGNIFGANGPKLTLFRAPYGEPYQAGPGPNFDKVASVVARHAVQVGWAIDSFDYNCAEGDANCVFNNFVGSVGTVGHGSYGVVLMHAVHSQTAGALARIIDYARAQGFVFKTSEDIVRARFGKSSAEIIGGTSTGPQSGVTYTFRAMHSGKVADVVNVSSAPGAPIQQWTDYRAPNQRFTARANGDGSFAIVTFNGQCLDVSNWSQSPGAPIVQWNCHGGANQRWRFALQGDGSYAVQSVNSNQCLDVTGVSTADGARLEQWPCSSGANQHFRLEP